MGVGSEGKRLQRIGAAVDGGPRYCVCLNQQVIMPLMLSVRQSLFVDMMFDMIFIPYRFRCIIVAPV